MFAGKIGDYQDADKPKAGVAFAFIGSFILGGSIFLAFKRYRAGGDSASPSTATV